MNLILQAQGVSKKFVQGSAELWVLRDINYSFAQGTSYALMGASGSGKSTFMHILAGLDTTTDGSVSFDNKKVASLNAKERTDFLNKQIGLLFQSPYLIYELTVLENAMIKGLIAGMSHKDAAKKAERLLDMVGIADKAAYLPPQLSGGQQQRLALARALFNQPAFLLADEPTGNLDAHTATEIIALLQHIQQETGMGIIISTHDERVAGAMDKRLLIKDGTLID
jgi:lipoprotein-releasing system ATP-binding protein